MILFKQPQLMWYTYTTVTVVIHHMLLICNLHVIFSSKKTVGKQQEKFHSIEKLDSRWMLKEVSILTSIQLRILWKRIGKIMEEMAPHPFNIILLYIYHTQSSSNFYFLLYILAACSKPLFFSYLSVCSLFLGFFYIIKKFICIPHHFSTWKPHM